MAKISKAYRAKIQKIINSTPKGKNQTTAKIFPKQWAKYDEYVFDDESQKIATQNKRDYGREFTKAVKKGEYQNIEYTRKNSRKASTFRIF